MVVGGDTNFGQCRRALPHEAPGRGLSPTHNSWPRHARQILAIRICLKTLCLHVQSSSANRVLLASWALHRAASPTDSSTYESSGNQRRVPEPL